MDLIYRHQVFEDHMDEREKLLAKQK